MKLKYFYFRTENQFIYWIRRYVEDIDINEQRIIKYFAHSRPSSKTGVYAAP